jgi:hypothetical protein
MDKATRLMQKGRLVEMRERLEVLRIKIDRARKEIIHCVYTLDSDDPRDINDRHLMQAAEELQAALVQYRALYAEVQEAAQVG